MELRCCRDFGSASPERPECIALRSYALAPVAPSLGEVEPPLDLLVELLEVKTMNRRLQLLNLLVPASLIVLLFSLPVNFFWIINKIFGFVGGAPVHLLLGVSEKEKYIRDLKDEYTRSKTYKKKKYLRMQVRLDLKSMVPRQRRQKSLLTLLSAPDLYTASAWFRVAFPS